MRPENSFLKQHFPAILAIVVTTIFWGLSYISTKKLLLVLTPLQVAGGRFLIAALILLTIGLASRRLVRVDRSDWLRMSGAAFLGIVLYFIFENSGLRLTTASMGSLIIATIPVLNVIVASLFLKQKVSGRSWLGVLLSMAGVFIIIRTGAGFSFSSLWGNLLVLGAAASWVGYTLISQPLTAKYDTLTLNIYQTLLGALFLFVMALSEGRPWPSPDLNIALNLGFLAVCCSASAYVFYLYALKHLGATVVTTFINFIPVCGVLGGVLFLGEKVGFNQIGGGLVIVFGVMLVTLNGSGKTNKQPQKDIPVITELAEKAK